MNTEMTLGEYLRRLRRAKHWQLQDVVNATGMSLSHLSRIENDAAVPNPATVVKLSKALDGELDRMLELADCLPREILDRYIRRASGSPSALRRSGGVSDDPEFARALVDDLEPQLRLAIARRFDLEERDVDGIFAVLLRMARLSPADRESVLKFFLPASEEQHG
jgi:transcriptional regulator with XRE-family HTH domain